MNQTINLARDDMGTAISIIKSRFAASLPLDEKSLDKTKGGQSHRRTMG